MTPQDLVRSRYPRAELQHRNAIFANGHQESPQPAEWVVYASGGLGNSVLGKGNSEEEAWANAAASVKDKSKKNMPGFREWLAKEAERERDAANQAKVIEEWTDSVLDLFAKMIRWLAEDRECAHHTDYGFLGCDHARDRPGQIVFQQSFTIRREERQRGFFIQQTDH